MDEQPGEVERLEIEIEPAAILVGGEELVDEPVEPAPLVVDDLDVPAQRGRVGVAPEDEARVAENARERRAQLVRDDRDQLRLRPLALAQLLVLALEVPAPRLDRGGHRVERTGELPDLGRALLRDADREVARGDPRRTGRDIADRMCDRPDEVAHHEQQQEAGGAERGDADQHGAVCLTARVRGAGGSQPVLAREQGRQPAPDLADARQPVLRRGRGERRCRADERDRDQGVSVVGRVVADVPDRRGGELPLGGLRRDEVRQLGGRLGEPSRRLVPALADPVVAREHEAAQALLELVDHALEPKRRRGHAVGLHLLVGRAP